MKAKIEAVVETGRRRKREIDEECVKRKQAIDEETRAERAKLQQQAGEVAEGAAKEAAKEEL